MKILQISAVADHKLKLTLESICLNLPQKISYVGYVVTRLVEWNEKRGGWRWKSDKFEKNHEGKIVIVSDTLNYLLKTVLKNLRQQWKQNW